MFNVPTSVREYSTDCILICILRFNLNHIDHIVQFNMIHSFVKLQQTEMGHICTTKKRYCIGINSLDEKGNKM